jgi:hypothetical protein
MTLTIINTEQIIAKFKTASIYINKVETKGRENGMIGVIHRDFPLYFPTYYSAYDYFNRKNII